MHMYGTDAGAFADSGKFASFWRLLATSSDREGREFAAIAQARDLPIFAVQFHPEKSIFEYDEPYDNEPFDGEAAHSEEAIEIAHLLAVSFVAAARNFGSFSF